MLLTVRDLIVKIEKIEALRGPVWKWGGPDRGLFRANGAGKTTTSRPFRAFFGPHQGDFFRGDPIHRMTPGRSSLGIVQVPEGRRLFPDVGPGKSGDRGLSPE
jgi:ABC-type branched-subunit amino acid transport system ATPase component